MIDHRTWFYFLTLISLIFVWSGTVALVIVALLQKPSSNPP